MQVCLSYPFLDFDICRKARVYMSINFTSRGLPLTMCQDKHRAQNTKVSLHRAVQKIKNIKIVKYKKKHCQTSQQQLICHNITCTKNARKMTEKFNFE